MGYAGACTVQAMDEIAGVCERMDVVEEKGDAVRDDVIMLDRKVEETEGRVVALRGEVEELRGWTRELSSSLLRERESTRALTIEMGQMRHLVNGLTGELGRLRDDHTRFVMSQRGLVRGRAESPAARLVEFQGRLVPIEELAPDSEVDRAASPVTIEVIDLTDDSDDVEVIDMAQEEEDQARYARMSGEETFHAEIERARADPSPEYPKDNPLPAYK